MTLMHTLKFLLIAATALLIMACQGETVAQTVDPKTFKPVAQEMTVTTGDKIEVVELFWFGCGHCFALEPSIKKWLKEKPANAEFVKVPAIFTSNIWEFHGKAFYTMKALDVPETAYEDFFKELHIKRNNIANLAQLADFLEAYGKTEEQVTAAFNSFDVDNKVRLAKKITRQSGAGGVPTMVVDGKYVTSQSLTGSADNLFDTIDQLVEKAAAER